MPKHPILPQNPSTLIGTAVLVRNGMPLLRKFEGMGAPSLDGPQGVLGDWKYRAGYLSGHFVVRAD
jgi:hypothetical protein